MAEALRKIYFGKAIIFQQALLPCSLSLAVCKDDFLPARNNCRKCKDSPLTCILCKFLTFELLKNTTLVSGHFVSNSSKCNAGVKL